MRKSTNKKRTSAPAPAPGQGQLTINLFAMFMSLAAFLAIQQGGLLLMNIMAKLTYPHDLSDIRTFFGSIMLIIFLTFLFGFASQTGFGLIRKTEAQLKIYLVYNVGVLLILIVQGLYVWRATAPMYTLPNILIGIATLYSIYSVYKGKPENLGNRFRFKQPTGRRLGR